MNNYHTHLKYFDDHAAGWDENGSIEKMVHLKKIFQKYVPPVRGNVLDIGCGTGILVPVLTEQLQGDHLILEFDFSRQMLWQNRLHRGNSGGQIRQINGDAHQLPFRNAQFDFVVCFAVLPHLMDQPRALHECRRVLTPEGKLLILHLMSSQRLNHFHSNAGETIREDRLLPVIKLSPLLRTLGFIILEQKEEDDLYLILAGKYS